MLQLLLGRSGSGKSEALLSHAETLAKQGHGKVFLLVPEQYSFAGERDLLMRLGAQMASRVAVVSFTRLADTVFREVGGMAGEQLDDGVRALMMSRALSEVAALANDLGEPLLGANPRLVSDSAYVEQLLALWEELRICAVSTQSLAQAGESLTSEQTLAAQTLQEKMKDFFRIFTTYEGLLADSGLEDTDKLSRLAQRLADSRLPDGAVVLVDGFKGFTAQELAILEQLLTRVDELTITLCTDTAGQRSGGALAREKTLFSPVTDTVEKLRRIAQRHGQQWDIQLLEGNRRNPQGALCALEAGLYAPAPAVLEEPTDAVTVTPCLDVYDECAYVARRIRRLLREDGVRCRDITIVARDLTPYQGLLEDALQQEGVDYYMDARQSLLDEPLLVYIRAALRVAVGGWRTEEILRLLKTDLTALDSLATAQVENYVYMWRIDGAAWTREWTENPAGLAAPVTAATAHTLAQLNSWRQQIIAPLNALREALRGGANGRVFALALYRFLTADEQLSARIMARVSGLEAMAEPLLAHHAARVWEEVMALLDRFAVALGDARLPSVQLEELFTMLAQMIDMGQIPQGLDAVTVGAADRIRYHRPRVVFMLGVNEGVFPAYPDEGGLLTEDERRTLAVHGVELTDDLFTRCIEERYFAYMAVAAANSRLFMSYHTSGENIPSPLITAVESILPHHAREAAVADMAADAESSEEMFTRLAEHYTHPSPAVESLRQVLADEPMYAGRLAAVERAVHNTPFRLEDGEVAATLFGDDMRLSASQTENFYQCRFSYFCRYGLRIQPRRVAQVDAASFGTIVHHVMETLLPVYTRPDGLVARLKAADAAREDMDEAAVAAAEIAVQRELLDTLSTAVHETVLAYAENDMGGTQNKSARFLYLLELAERSAYNMLWHTVMELRQSEFTPVAFELGICPTDEADAAEAEIPSLRVAFPRGSVRLRGKVDRVDLYVRFDGKAFVRVVDYKTGSKTFDLHELTMGLNMQMLLYLYTICDYPQRLSADVQALQPAGVLYQPLSDLAVSRDAGDKAQKKRLASMRMDGLVLDDASVVQAMEREADRVFIPAKIGKGGTAEGSVITATHFTLLRGVVEQLLENMATRLLDGDIAALPMHNGNYTACQYCDYRAVCARDEDAPVNELGTRSMAEVLEDLENHASEQEVSDGE